MAAELLTPDTAVIRVFVRGDLREAVGVVLSHGIGVMAAKIEQKRPLVSSVLVRPDQFPRLLAWENILLQRGSKNDGLVGWTLLWADDGDDDAPDGHLYTE